MLLYYDIKSIDLPGLSDGRCYIYVVENFPQGNVKVGMSHDVRRRMCSLSGSNSGGNEIASVAVSEATWLYSIEGTVHTHFDRFRIPGTEWFSGLSFSDVVCYVDALFDSEGYRRCNNVRQDFLAQHALPGVVRGRQ